MSEANNALRKRSGEVNSKDPMMGLFYDLLRDHVPPSTMEKLVRENTTGEEQYFTNGWLAKYAEDLVMRFREMSFRTRVQLKGCGLKKIMVIKVLRDHLKIGLKEAKNIADGAPIYIETSSPEKARLLVDAILTQGGDALIDAASLEAMKEVVGDKS